MSYNGRRTLQILNNIKDRYEAHHHVSYTDDAITACVKLTDRYITDRSFPDKAIDAMDEVGARVHLQNAQVPPEIIELKKQLDEIAQEKKDAVKNQNFELAANFRDKQTALERNLQEAQQKWERGDDSTAWKLVPTKWLMWCL